MPDLCLLSYFIPDIFLCVCMMFASTLIAFPHGVLGQVFYSDVSILDLCLAPYFYFVLNKV